jgi:hypothetical protein
MNFEKPYNELNITLAKKNTAARLAYHGAIAMASRRMIILGCPEIHQDYFVNSPRNARALSLCEHAGHNETLKVEMQHGCTADDVPLVRG